MPPLSKEFLLSRGSCCGNGCYNCPYIPRATRGAIKVNEEEPKKPDKEKKK